jgi:hypothetical protein
MSGSIFFPRLLIQCFPTALAASAFTMLGLLAGCKSNTVLTYHYDNYRSGWNHYERTLTSSNVASSSFGQLFNIPLDDQVDVQPLVFPLVNVTVGSNQGAHNVVYVATESNTIYMIDTVSGQVLYSKSFGAPVSSPQGCTNNGPNVGIDGTPVIDEKSLSMFVITYTLEKSQPTYTLHQLDLGSLADKKSIQIDSSNTTHLGFSFQPAYQRQRAALLEANGNIYAGFGSFCDLGGTNSRGWVLGWNASTLSPLPANQLNNTLTSEPNGMFLSSVWMSGSGLAADNSGNVYFVTGNTDQSGTTYSPTANISESAVKMSSDLTTVESYFTPADVGTLDHYDTDFGSGGIMLIPKAFKAPARLGAAAGKDGNLYLLDLSNLGGESANGIGGTPVQVGNCWCAQSYFYDGDLHIVSSGGTSLMLWKLQTSPTVALTQQATSGSFAGNGSTHDPGFFTAISSNGAKSSSDPIIWAVSRPTSYGSATSPAPLNLVALKGQPSGTTLQQIFSAQAGAWWTPMNNANPNIVPVVVNGKVFVASYKQLRIFGLH